MIAQIRKSWVNIFRRRGAPALEQDEAREKVSPVRAQIIDFDVAPNDPLLAYLLNVSSVVEIEPLQLESPTLRRLKEEGVKVVVPLISQGELIGLLNLGPRRSEQEYSTDDRRLLNTLAAQAAPALRVAQLARQQQAEARERERIAQEMRVARVIQQTLLPKEIPVLPGWQMAAHWQPARAVSGDFYDFINFPDGRMGIIVADVTDKGVPAALVMATTRSILRTAAEHAVLPGKVLEQANNTLCPDIPPNMFVTCLYMLMDPNTGHLWYANAGHNLPYQRTSQGVVELRARGMPLGLMPDMPYEEKEADMAEGDQIVLYSDGLIEAHNPQGEMFGFPRLRELLGQDTCVEDLIVCMLNELGSFTGPEWEQEDDVTFVSVAREARKEPAVRGENSSVGEKMLLTEFEIASQPGNERQAMQRVGDAVADLGMPATQVERLKTAVAEATMNAMEHGNRYQPDLPVDIEVWRSAEDVHVYIRDHGGSQILPVKEDPDLDAKLAGLQSPRGWGLFLIKNMVDEMRINSDQTHHTVELIMHRKGEQNDDHKLSS
jgi:serine phosphatase RsbU (regulator of sigma subunit)/anti-sigma regulatory factor (Ser/Thr protein kinase)